MKVKRKWICAFVLTAMLIFGSAPAALADGGYYYGTFDSGFTAGQTFNKIRDNYAEDQNAKASQPYDSQIRVAGALGSGKLQRSGELNQYIGPEQGRVTLTVSRAGYGSTSVKGMLYVYGTTPRQITDRSHYWGTWDF